MLEPVAIMFSSQPSENRLQPCKSCIAQGYHIGCMELERAVFGTRKCKHSLFADGI